MATAAPATLGRAVFVGGDAVAESGDSRGCQMRSRTICSALASRNGLYFKPISGEIRALIAQRRCDRNRGLIGLQVLNCLIPGVDGSFWEDSDDGCISGDYISTRKGSFKKEFSVLANMLKQIEPLDTGVIGKGASDNCKESMKRTISSMFGVLPSDQFHVSVRISRQPLARLLVSSIMTGYTLWNAEYRLSLQRMLEVPAEGIKDAASVRPELFSCENREKEAIDYDGVRSTTECFDESLTDGKLGLLSQEASNYIEQLKSKLSIVEKELDEQKQRHVHIGSGKEENNDLLEYLRSLEPEMVAELSCPSSPEVEEVIQQLVQNILQKYLSEGASVNLLFGGSDNIKMDNNLAELANTFAQYQAAVTASRDYLARLLFWCMLLGHHMRSLEYRLHLSCHVGIS
eukprot:Gb_08046 [translate_table: standard]